MYRLDDMTISQLFNTLIWQAPDVEMEEGAYFVSLESLGYTRDDIDPRDQATLIEEFRTFVQSNQDDVHDFMEATGSTLDQVAHDYILTRNRHGAGFWDRGAGDVGERLTDAAHVYGENDVYISDDCGQLHIYY